jgi:hypothetical protein
VSDGVIVKTYLQQDVKTKTAAATARSSTDKAAVSTPDNVGAGAQQHSHVNGNSSISASNADTLTAVSSGSTIQQQQEQSLPTLTPLSLLYTSGNCAPHWHCTERDAPIRQRIIQVCLEKWLAAVAALPHIPQSECGVLATILEARMYSEAGSLDLYSCELLLMAAIARSVAIFESTQQPAQPAPDSIDAKPGKMTVARLRYLNLSISTAVDQALADIAQHDEQQQQQQQSRTETLHVSKPQSASSSCAQAAQLAAAESTCDSSGARSSSDVAAAACTAAGTASLDLLCSVGVSASTLHDAAVQSAMCSTTTCNAAAADEICKCSAPAADSSASNTVSSSNAFEVSCSSKSSDAQQQQQQQQQHVSTGAATTTVVAAAVAGTEVVDSTGSVLIDSNWHTVQTDGTSNRSSSTLTVSSDSAHVTVPVVQHNSTSASASAGCANSIISGSDESTDCATNTISCTTSSNSSNSNSSESKWVRGWQMLR